MLDFSLEPNPAVVDQTVVLLGNLNDQLGQPLSRTGVSLYVGG